MASAPLAQLAGSRCDGDKRPSPRPAPLGYIFTAPKVLKGTESHYKYEIVVLKRLSLGRISQIFQNKYLSQVGAKYVCGENEGSKGHPQIH